jgi:hypothetical protein
MGKTMRSALALVAALAVVAVVFVVGANGDDAEVAAPAGLPAMRG